MKCVVATRASSYPIIKRVDDDKAREMVATGEWAYCAKKYWKEMGRTG